MRESTRTALEVCPVEATMSVIGACWKLSIVQQLLNGTHRFGELRRVVGTVTDRVLTRQLRELEDDGLVLRTVYAEVPPKVEYSLTPLGETLGPLVQNLDDWGKMWAQAQAEVNTDIGAK